MPDDFVVFGFERKSIFRFIRIGPDSWEKKIRCAYSWDFHDNVGEASAKDAFENPHNQVFAKQK